jgi:putative protein-disulfide isomerase
VNKQKIIYAFDPLCGWCFGFHFIINRLKDEFEDRLDFEIKSGGLIIGKRICKISEKAKYLKKSMPDVERITGVEFGEKFIQLLDEGEYISNSIPPSIAFNVFKSFRPDIAFEIAHTIQRTHYIDGMDLNNIRPYFKVAEKFGINKFGFMERYEDPMYERFTHEEFDLVKGWGAEHYPSILLEREGEVEMVAEGYVSYETLKADFIDIINDIQANA